MTVTVLRGIGQRYIDAALLEFVRLFSWLHWNDRFWGRKTTVVKCHFHRIWLKVHPINAIDHCWCWPWSLGRGGLSWYIHSEGTLFSLFLHCHLWKESPMPRPLLRSRELYSPLFKGGVFPQIKLFCRNYLEFFSICLFSPRAYFMKHFQE